MEPGEETPQGGDPVCWLDRVCPECGRFAEDDSPRCERCGAEFPSDRD